MKKRLWLLGGLAGLLLSASPVEALELEINCNQFELRGGVEALYWRGCEQGVEYGFFGKNLPNGGSEVTQLELQPSYGWGFRLFASVRDLCSPRFAELEWIRYQHTTTATSNNDQPSKGNLLVISSTATFNFQPAESIRTRQRERYNNATLRVGQYLLCDCWGGIYGYLGGGWREIDVKDHNDYKATQTNSRPVTQDSNLHLSGGAITFGFGANFNVGCGFGADVRTGFVVVLGRFKHFYSSFGTNAGGNLFTNTSIEPTQTNCITGYEAEGSIHYTRDCGCVSIRGEVGYRIDYYFGLAAKSNSFANSTEPTEEVNRGYGGPFIGASIWY